ncbi:MAG TPA: DUF177 domain-containing protein [Acidimicrobiales bacterium]|nr:DUF177 domain-containing protein [Acidimicrobiales bacterium]
MAVPDDAGPPAAVPVEELRRVRRPFLVQVAALRKQNGATRVEHREGLIPGLGAVSVVVPDDEPVVLDVTLASYPGGITVDGTVTAGWHGECRRCGGPVAGRMSARVRERFAPRGGTDRDEEAYPLEGDELDLEPLARDAVLLELPLAPLCADDCAGLCPTCGANRNTETCGCAPVGDPRWAALDALRDEGPPI